MLLHQHFSTVSTYVDPSLRYCNSVPLLSPYLLHAVDSQFVPIVLFAPSSNLTKRDLFGLEHPLNASELSQHAIYHKSFGKGFVLHNQQQVMFDPQYFAWFADAMMLAMAEDIIFDTVLIGSPVPAGESNIIVGVSFKIVNLYNLELDQVLLNVRYENFYHCSERRRENFLFFFHYNDRNFIVVLTFSLSVPIGINPVTIPDGCTWFGNTSSLDVPFNFTSTTLVPIFLCKYESLGPYADLILNFTLNIVNPLLTQLGTVNLMNGMVTYADMEYDGLLETFELVVTSLTQVAPTLRGDNNPGKKHLCDTANRDHESSVFRLKIL